ncbi:amidohydrolase family protein [Porifericola rhodea]|uniref:N-acyl-D-amino-acid deacylase family protein n=1 Tax=Porifericola rhodea TaxID=930972 RepID=UPI002664F38E|nr:amidohydrolase family protein [Porifericola rhodea]WKN32943.1 amidohydrolase family protein [Porifericola rhodea]
MQKLLIARLSFGLFILCACSSQPSAFEQYIEKNATATFNLLIYNASIIDGTGKAAYAADVLVSGDSIAFIGEVDTTKLSVERKINASGKTVSPGFIDTHAHGNPLKTPEFKNFLAMGATTIALGKDGSSPAYPNLSLWMKEVEDSMPAVNIAMFVGHGTLRLLSGIKYNPRPSQEQVEKMGRMLADNLDAGCFGMTTGLEYIPGTYAPAYELEYLAKIVGSKGKLITSHIRNEDNNKLESSLKELFLQGKYCQVQVSHLKVVYGKGEQRAEEILNLLAEAREEGIQVAADVYPYTASYTGISIVFPDWALPPNDYQQVVANKRAALAKYLRDKVNQRNGPTATLIGTSPWAGKTLAQVAQELDKSFEDVLIDDIGPGGASGAYFVMDDTLQTKFIADSTVMICSDGSPTSRHPRGHGTFAKIIEQYIVRDSLLSLEEGIRKMTSLPASTLGLNDRGVLAVGKRADILIFDPIEVKAKADYENPFQLAEGFDYVIVNGQVSKENNEFSLARHGKVLRRF